MIRSRGRTQHTAAIVAVTLGAVIATFGIVYGAPSRALEGLDAEYNPPAFFSGAVLLTAAVLVYLRARRLHGLAGAAGEGLAALLAVMSADEVVGLHEWAETHTGIDWQLLYLPLILLAGIGALVLIRALPPAAALAFLGGGAAWASAQVLEAVQWNGDDLAHPFLVLPEELLEMTGSSLFVVAMLIAPAADRAFRRTRGPATAQLGN